MNTLLNNTTTSYPESHYYEAKMAGECMHGSYEALSEGLRTNPCNSTD
jgi:hypothetical protein